MLADALLGVRSVGRRQVHLHLGPYPEQMLASHQRLLNFNGSGTNILRSATPVRKMGPRTTRQAPESGFDRKMEQGLQGI